jgi:hypothetical protein
MTGRHSREGHHRRDAGTHKTVAAQLRAEGSDVTRVEFAPQDPRRVDARVLVPATARLCQPQPNMKRGDPRGELRIEYAPRGEAGELPGDSPLLAGCLQAFLRLVPPGAPHRLFEAPREMREEFASDTLEFAKTWGILEFCTHRLPVAHIGLSRSYLRQPCISLAYRDRDQYILWTPLDRWWALSTQATAIFNIMVKHRDGDLGNLGDWDAVARAHVPGEPVWVPTWPFGKPTLPPGVGNATRPLVHRGVDLRDLTGRPDARGFRSPIHPPDAEAPSTESAPITPAIPYAGAPAHHTAPARPPLAWERQVLHRVVNRWLEYGRVMPIVSDQDGTAVLTFRVSAPGGLFGVLALQLAATYAARDVVRCSRCNSLYSFERRPRPDLPNYCGDKCRDEARRATKRRSWHKMMGRPAQ